MKTLIILLAIFITALGFPYSALAQGRGAAPKQNLNTKSSSLFQFLSSINPLNTNLQTIDGLINTLLPFIFVLAGLILFLMLIAGGFQLLTSAANPKTADAGKQRITTALIGFLIIVVAYWLTQIVEIILGINILK